MEEVIYIDKSFEVIRPPCVHRIVLLQKTFFFFQIVLYLNMPKINWLVSGSNSSNQRWLQSRAEMDFLLASCGSLLGWPRC